MPIRWSRAGLLAALAACFGLVLAPLPAAQKKPKPQKEETTQTLQLPRELPSAVAGDTRRLTFHVTPLSSRGLLSAQVRDALKTLTRETAGAPVLHIRAFVAGSGDLRRVRDLVSEVFAAHRQPLPALSLIRSGGLPLEGAQVAMEAVASARKDVNPHGLAFFAAPAATSANPLDPAAPLIAQSLETLRGAIRSAGLEDAAVLKATCFVSTLDDAAATRKLVEAVFPRAALTYVQTQRSPSRAFGACEAVARLHADPPRPLVFLPESGEPAVALVASPRLVLTGTQVSYGFQEANSRLAFERLGKALEAAGASVRGIAFARFYPLAEPLAAQVRKLRGEFFAAPPASLVLFEGLSGLDAGFAVDLAAVKD